MTQQLVATGQGINKMMSRIFRYLFYYRITAYGLSFVLYGLVASSLVALFLAGPHWSVAVFGHAPPLLTMAGLIGISLIVQHMDIPSLMIDARRRARHNFSNTIPIIVVALWGWPTALWLAGWGGLLEVVYRAVLPYWDRQRPHSQVLHWWLQLLDKPLHYPQKMDQSRTTYLQNATGPLIITILAIGGWYGLTAYVRVLSSPSWQNSLGLMAGIFALVLLLNWAVIFSIAPFVPWATYQQIGDTSIWREALAVTRIEGAITVLTLGATAIWHLWGMVLMLSVIYEMMLQLTRQRRITEQEQIIAQEREASRTDPLTHLPNRRSLEEYAHSITDAGLPAIIAILDIDHFKQVNDTWGHDVGDVVLKNVAERLAHACRTQRTPWPDMVGRWGGEEFVVILPQMPPNIAPARLDAIRQAIQSPIVLPHHDPLAITASAGAVAVAQSPWDLSTAVKAADTGLYWAKEHGRDQWHWALPNEGNHP